MFKLEKRMKFYKNQFDEMIYEIYGSHTLDRLSIDLDSLLFRFKYMIKRNKDLDKLSEIEKEFSEKSLMMRKIFGDVIYHLILEKLYLGTEEDLVDILVKDLKIDSIYLEYTLIVISENEEFLKRIDSLCSDEGVYDLYPEKFFRFYTDSYNDGIAKAYPELFEKRENDTIGVGHDHDVFVHNLTFQTSERCSLQCLPAGSRILMSDFTFKNIENIQLGDKVFGFEENCNSLENLRLIPSKVTHLFKGESNDLYEISSPYFKNPIVITGEHPILSEDGWRTAVSLNQNKIAITNFDIENIQNIEITSTHRRVFISSSDYSIRKLNESRVVYNFETESNTYITERLLVHNCTYCYQFNKSNMKMDFETARRFIDKLVTDQYGYINRYNSPAIILEFIGGEPLLEINLTRRIYEYFLDRTYELNHPWFKLHRVSICSNGLQYFDKEVQDFFSDYVQNISFNISIDGNKELHDACRIQPNGEGSYDIDMLALNHFNKHYTPERNSKMTLAPQNMKYLFESVKSFIENGMHTINLNCIFEEGWNEETARLEYYELKKLADYILENDLEHLFISIFNERQEDVQDKEMDGNFCFHGNSQILTNKGHIKISSLQEGDKVYTASGNVHKVTHISRRISSKNLLLKVRGCTPVRCTYDHKFLSRKKENNEYGRIQFSPLYELNKEDLIALPILKFKGNAVPPELSTPLAFFLSNGSIDENWIVLHECDPEKIRFLNLDFIHRDNAIYLYRKANPSNEKLHALCSLSYKEIIHKLLHSSFRAVEKFLETFISSNIYSDELINDVMILARSIGYIIPQNKFNGRYSISLEKAKIDNKLNVIWSTIESIEIDKETYEVYCPVVYPDDIISPEEHTIVVNGLAATNCGAGSASMLALRPNGQFYPCIRYMPTSVGPDKDDLCLGSVDTQLIGRQEGSEIIKMLDMNTRRGQVTDICYNCPIGNDCPSCSALGVTVFNCNNKKVTFICIQMIAEALANVYYWNLLSIKHPEYNLPVRKNNVPDVWSKLVLEEEELQLLRYIEAMAMIKKIENNQ